MHRKHLQEIPDSGSNVSVGFTWGWHPSKTSELLSGMGVSALKDKLGSENTPQEQLTCVGPPLKQAKVKDAEFVIARRPRSLRETATGISWDALPDELLLGIFSYLPLIDLLKVSQVCRRWHRLSVDESLWQTLDLAGKILLPGVIGQLLPLGIIAFRCPRSSIGNPLFKTNRPLQVQHMDLSNCTIKVADLQCILGRCQQLQNLSLEGLVLSDDIIKNTAQNSRLVRLNLSGCSGFSAESLEMMLDSCSRLEELNLAWCDFTTDHIRAAVNHIPARLTQLNLSGYRQNLLMTGLWAACIPGILFPIIVQINTMLWMLSPASNGLIQNVKILLQRCSSLVHLDLSDSVMLKPECFQYFHQLTYLEHLSLSRCYQIPPAALLDLGEITSLKSLQVFGIVTASSLPLLKATLPHIKINSSHFTPIARPTVSGKKNQEIWGIQCKLSLKNPVGL